MIEMTDLALELFDVFAADAEFFGCEVSVDRYRPRGAHAPIRAQRNCLASAFLADQEINGSAFSLQEFFNQAFTDEAGGSRDEIMHFYPPPHWQSKRDS